MVRHVIQRAGLAAGVAAVIAATATAGPAYAGPAAPGPAGHPVTAKAGRSLAGPAVRRHEAALLRRDQALAAAQGLDGQAVGATSDIAGVRLDAQAGVVHVYRKDTARALPDGIGAGVEVSVHPARFSHSEMVRAAGRIAHDARLLGEQRVSVQAVGPAIDGSGIELSVVLRGADDAAELSRASSVLHGRYGSIVGRVTGSHRRTSEQELYFGGWRFNDFAPWFGGDRIASSLGGCTSGFAADYNGRPTMLTAAHCGPVGTAFYNGPRTNGTYLPMGSSVYSNTATDIGAIDVSSYTQYINVAPADDATAQLYVPAWDSPVVGQVLCQSGSYTGEVCNLLVVDKSQSVCLTWFLWWCTGWQSPLADVVNLAGPLVPAAGHGDSGAPVYSRSSDDDGSGTARGLVHGQLTPNASSAFPDYFPDDLWCQAPEGLSRRCSSGFSFAHMPGY